MIDILMPRLSDTMETGTIAVWHKQPGDRVDVGDILVEIETDKAVMEYEAYDAGTLGEILVAEGDQATIGAVIAHLDDGRPREPERDAPLAVSTPQLPAESDASPGSSAAASAAPSVESAGGTPHTAPHTAAGQRLFATPLVRRLARESAIDLSRVTGSGPGGRIVRADIEDALAGQAADQPAAPGEAPAPAAPVAAPALGSAASPAPANDARQSTAIPFDKTRQVISRRLTESSSTTPHFYVTAVADIDELLALRADLNAHTESSGRSKISINDLLVRATAIALREHPGVNASYSPDGQGQTLMHGRVNIGIAVASDAGLVVPVITDSDQKTTSLIASESQRLSALARDRGLTAAEMSGGTFTISNLGMYGVQEFTAIINPPEGAILAVGAAQAEPVVIDGAIEIRHRLRYTLSADHRIIDGALAAQFLATLTGLLERPLGIVA